MEKDEKQSFIMSILEWDLDVKITNFEVLEDADGGYLSFDMDFDGSKLVEIGTTHKGVEEKVGELMIEAIKAKMEEEQESKEDGD